MTGRIPFEPDFDTPAQQAEAEADQHLTELYKGLEKTGGKIRALLTSTFKDTALSFEEKDRRFTAALAALKGETPAAPPAPAPVAPTPLVTTTPAPADGSTSAAPATDTTDQAGTQPAGTITAPTAPAEDTETGKPASLGGRLLDWAFGPKQH